MTAVALLAERHALHWRGRLRPLDTGAFDERSVIAKLPFLVAEVYPEIGSEELTRAAVALCLFSDAVVLSDDIIDYAAAAAKATRRLPDVAVLYAQAYRTFAELYAGAAAFWDRLEKYFIEYIDAMDLEEHLASGERKWSSISELDCLSAARGKNGLVRLVNAAVSALAPNGCFEERIEQILLAYFVANQMVDDLRDWREDVREGALSLLLRRACDERPRVERLEDIGRRIYLGGHAVHVLDLALNELNMAAGHARAIGAHGLLELCMRRSERLAALRVRLCAETAARR